MAKTLSADMVSEGVDPILGPRHPGYVDPNQRLRLFWGSGHACVGDKVNIESGELRRTQKRRRPHSECDSGLGDPLPWPQDESKVIAYIPFCSSSESCFRLIETPNLIVEIDIHTVAGIASKPSKQRRGAFEDPAVGVIAGEDAKEEPVVGELAQQVGQAVIRISGRGRLQSQ